MDIKETLAAASVSPAEFGELCGVSKNMVYKWLRGAKPHPLRAEKVRKILAAIAQATVDQDLPLASLGDTRQKRLQTVVITNIKKMV